MKLTRAGLFLKPDLANISLEHTRPVSPSLRMKWILCFTNPWPKGPGLYSKGVIGQVLEICFGLSSLLGQYVLNKLKTLSWNGFYNHPCVPCVLGVEKDRSTRPRWWFQIFFIFIPIFMRILEPQTDVAQNNYFFIFFSFWFSFIFHFFIIFLSFFFHLFFHFWVMFPESLDFAECS